jgi:hypothetical protein
VCVTGQKPYLGPPKTRTSVRTVKAVAITVAALERHLEAYPPVEVEVWDRTDPRQTQASSSYRQIGLYLWLGPPASPFKLGKHLGACCTGCGLSQRCRPAQSPPLLRYPAHPPGRECQAGPARPRPRHSTPTITLNTYVGEWPDTDQETGAIMDAALGQVPRMCPPSGRLR